MLRRLSDVTINSLEKYLNIGSGSGTDEKKRKLAELEEYSKNGSRLRKSKGHWDLSSCNDNDDEDDDQEEEEESSDKSFIIEISENNIDSGDEDKFMISSDFPSDLSINEQDWTDYLSLNLNLEMDIESSQLLNLKDSEFYKSLKMKEERRLIGIGNVLRNHFDLTFVMRAKLINWTFEVAVHYKLHRETIHSCQSLLDLYLNSCEEGIPRTRLQLIGLAALFISSKLEEIQPPNLHDLVQICDELYCETEIAEMELEICSKLRWNLCPNNSLIWLRFYMNNLIEEAGRDCASDYIMGNCRVDYVRDCNVDYNREYYNDNFRLLIEEKLDFLIHFKEYLDFKPSNLSAALIYLHTPKREEDQQKILNCTGKRIENLQSEIDWIRSINLESDIKFKGKVASNSLENNCDLSDQEFVEIIENNKKALRFILNQIKKCK